MTILISGRSRLRSYGSHGNVLQRLALGVLYRAADRFQIQSITWTGLPDLILYSETMSPEQLEATLNLRSKVTHEPKY